VNEEKNTAGERAIQNNTRANKKAYKLARTKEKRLFRKKARQLDALREKPHYFSIILIIDTPKSFFFIFFNVNNDNY
jgi:hypothetical protein